MTKDLEILNMRSTNDLGHASKHRDMQNTNPSCDVSMRKVYFSVYVGLVTAAIFLTDSLSHSAAARLTALFNGFTSITPLTFKAMVATQ